MNARDRVLTTLDLKEPDHVPIFEGTIDNIAIAKEFGGKTSIQGLRKTMRAISRVPGWRAIYSGFMKSGFVYKLGTDRLYAFNKKVGIDMVLAMSSMMLTKCKFPTWNSFVDEFGRMQRIELYNGTDQFVYVDGFFKSREEYEAWGPVDPNHPAREQIIKHSFKMGDKHDLLVAVFLVGVVEPTWESFGFETFSHLLYKENSFMRKVFEDRGKFSLDLANVAMDLGAEVLFMHDDLGYKGRPFFSPRMMEELVYPYYQRVVEAAHKRGVKVLLHSCGNIMDLVPTLVKIGFDGLNPIEPTAGMDIFEMKRKYGDRITLIGNVSPQDLATGTADYIAAYTRRLLREVAPGGGYILASGHSINPYVKKENYLAMLGVVKQYGTYPIHDIPS
nr:uroporphyrinogen decarboxylase family protein [Candidatus Sigynarchaeota archaeon]